jgi:glyoxylase-like metal-dependent hydrolase (beta-lactamase superfamily II)
MARIYSAANASIEKLRGLDITTVYPGHGEPFPMDLFLAGYRPNQAEGAR